MESILLVGENAELLECRARVVSMMDAAITCCAPAQFPGPDTSRPDLVVLCHSLSPGQQRTIAAASRHRWTGIPLLHLLPRLEDSHGSSQFEPSATVESKELTARAVKLLRTAPFDQERIFLLNRHFLPKAS